MKNYYILSNGRVRREANSLVLERADGKKAQIPVEDVDSLYLYGEVDINTKLLNFLSQKRLPLHVFNYYGYYSGSYYPREYLHSGYLLVHQVKHYADPALRCTLTREIVQGSAHSMLRNIAYYSNRRKMKDDPEPAGEIATEAPSTSVPTDEAAEALVDSSVDLDLADDAEADPFASEISFEAEPHPLTGIRTAVEALRPLIEQRTLVNDLRGIEGKMRTLYYQGWQHILSEDWVFDRRTRRPPENEVNALISFGNSMLYTICVSEIYRTQLTPTISYLHEPGARRFSLGLDLSEMFKPILVDRAIFRLVNSGQLKAEHFDNHLGGCYLTESGRKLFLNALEERLGATIKHRRLGRHVSYRHLIRLECYKLIRHITGLEPYRAFRAWW